MSGTGCGGVRRGPQFRERLSLSLSIYIEREIYASAFALSVRSACLLRARVWSWACGCAHSRSLAWQVCSSASPSHPSRCPTASLTGHCPRAPEQRRGGHAEQPQGDPGSPRQGAGGSGSAAEMRFCQPGLSLSSLPPRSRSRSLRHGLLGSPTRASVIHAGSAQPARPPAGRHKSTEKTSGEVGRPATGGAAGPSHQHRGLQPGDCGEHGGGEGSSTRQLACRRSSRDLARLSALASTAPPEGVRDEDRGQTTGRASPLSASSRKPPAHKLSGSELADLLIAAWQ